MPSAVESVSSDMASSASGFSYAQAAKGRSPSQPATPDASKATSDTSDTPANVEKPNGYTTPEKSNGTVGLEDTSKADEVTTVNGSAQQPSTHSTATETHVEQPAKVNGASEKVEESSANSNNVIGGTKDDASSAAATDTEATWEKVSQPSNTEEKEATQSNADADDSKLSSWEEVPPPAQLKEAPLPTVNIWTKRAADAMTKTKDTKSSPRQESGFSPKDNSEGPTTMKSDVRKKSAGGQIIAEEKGGEEVKSVRSTKPPGSRAYVPPPSDAMSWPTPESAKEEEKKKPQDKVEKVEPEKASNKSHGKEKWVQMPYVPSAVFNTPLPTTSRRGGRPRGGREGGGRGGHTVNGSISGDRTPSGSTAPGPSSNERVRGDMGPPKPGAFPPKSKRASSAGPASSREQRKAGDVVNEDGSSRSFNRNTGPDGRRISSATQTDGARQGSPPSRRYQDSGRDERSQSAFSGRRDGSGRHDMSRESSAIPPRGEGRPDRGRGGYRGRGGHNGFGGHGVNGQSSGFAGSSGPQFPPSKSQSYSEQRFSSQSQNPSFGHQREPKHFRSGSRSQSITNPANYNRFHAGGPMPGPGPQGLPHLQTDAANMYYGPQAVMSAMPFNVMEQVQLASMIQMQMEYYFSIDNLVRDTFLRKHMDSQGYVLLSVLLNFNRIKQLTTDVEPVRAACWRSPQIEFQTGNDGQDRLRVSRDWTQWVLPMTERDSDAQNDGPSHLYPPTLPYGQSGFPTPPMMSPGSFTGPQYRAEPGSINGGQPSQTPSGDESVAQTPLSAAAPQFEPIASAGDQGFLPPHPENSFPDEQVENLTIVVKKERSDPQSDNQPPPSHRTFSNGSIDAKAVSEEFSNLGLSEHPGVTANGDKTPESHSRGALSRSKSPLSIISAPRQSSGELAPPVFWVKDNDTPLEGLPPNLVAESYSVFRQNALKQREKSFTSQNYDMHVLYQFWSHFLIRNFNLGMYKEFKKLAIEDDSSIESVVGLENLVTFYDASILGKDLVSDMVAYDYVNLARQDFQMEKKDRPAFQKLRASWRNGALPLRDRIKIDKLLEPELKAVLDR